MSIIDLYYKLYHRRGPSNGSDIDMSEQGRVGGLSTGQPFKFTDLVNYAIKITEVGDVTYIAYANPGTAQSSASWKAMKLDATSGTVITWANGRTDFENVATDLTALTYS